MKLSPSSLLQFDTCPHQFYRLRVARDVEPDPPGPALRMGTRAHKAFEDRLEERTSLPADLMGWEPLCVRLLERCTEVHTEQPLALTYNLEPCSYGHPAAWLRGYVDFLGFAGSKALVIDWKTGKRRPKALQLDVYTLAVLLSYPKVQSVTSMFVWTREQSHDSYTWPRSHLAELTSKVLAACAPVDRALQQDKWEKSPSGLCHSYCPVVDCEHNGRS